ncbi:MAG: hypothetical protein HC933_10590 [Pleurocapsa sp. SU_196_0]|nr:hypothetical protein [Pleurocapsa sp. SU_196_0]
MSLLKPQGEYEPLTLTRTAPVAAVYALLGVIALGTGFALMSVNAYRENAGITLESARRQSLAVLPVVVALVTSSLALFAQATLMWRSSRWAFVVGALIFAATFVAALTLPSSLRQYAVIAGGTQILALGGYALLRRLPRLE